MALALGFALVLSSQSLAQSVSTQVEPALNNKEPPVRVALSLPPATEAVLTRLSSIRQQIRAGAMQLALRRLASEAPPTLPNKDWHLWSVQRWNQLILLQQWQELKQLISTIPPGFPQSLKDEASIYRARAMLELGQHTEASLLIRQLLESGELTEENLKAARSLLIDLYLKGKDFENALIEANRYNEEFNPQSSQWFVQRALIAIQAGQLDDAVGILGPVAAPEAKLLQTYARIANGSITPPQATGAVMRVLGKKRVAEELKHFGEALLIFAEAQTSAEEKNWSAYIETLERYLASDETNPYAYLLDYTTDHLVDSYLAHAETLVNRAQLLSNDIEAWYTLADRRVEAPDANDSNANDEALSLYLTIRHQADVPAMRVAAMNKAIGLFLEAGKADIVNVLFGENRPFGSFEGIDSALVSKLLNFGLRSSKTDFVASLAPHIGEAPEKIEPEDWLIHNGRINIFIGRFDAARTNIQDWLDMVENLDGAHANQILQLVFDLQAIDQHDLALDLLQQIKEKTNSSKHQREIAFWMAESHEANGDLLQAANFYTQSALAEANGFDDWGQSARFHAAEMLTKSGYYDDAESLYQSILVVTKDPARVETIRQALQQLWLLRQ